MQRFKTILFVSQGLADESAALSQALSIARNNGASLTAMIVCPELPKAIQAYEAQYEQSLRGKFAEALAQSRAAVKVSEEEIPVPVTVERGKAPSVRIIQQVLRRNHDLVIKQAEPKDGGYGFKALDTDLLRKCPCPVWLSRPITRHRDEMQVAVAIDPEKTSPEGHDLSVSLLKLARSLADTCSGTLHIISCWHYEYEGALRHSPWISVSAEEADSLMQEAENEHGAALNAVIAESGIGGDIRIHHLHGRAETMIPHAVAELEIDIVVMGTVARVGIPGFFIGNTAENTVQRLGSALLALKPNGFVSPVNAN